MKMKKNIGELDRTLRFVAAIIFAVLGYLFHWGFYVFAGILAVTAYIKWCPPYHLLGISTKKK